MRHGPVTIRDVAAIIGITAANLPNRAASSGGAAGNLWPKSVSPASNSAVSPPVSVKMACKIR
jgi:hypothetical protein